MAGATTNYLVDTLNPTGLPQVLDEIVSGSVMRTYTYGLDRIGENQLINGTWTPSFYGYDGHGNALPDEPGWRGDGHLPARRLREPDRPNGDNHKHLQLQRRTPRH